MRTLSVCLVYQVEGLNWGIKHDTVLCDEIVLICCYYVSLGITSRTCVFSKKTVFPKVTNVLCITSCSMHGTVH